jgi:hypothetical protein
MRCPQFGQSNFEGTSIVADLPHVRRRSFSTGHAAVGSCDIRGKSLLKHVKRTNNPQFRKFHRDKARGKDSGIE